MSVNTTKIFNDDNEYITLLELSKSQKYSLEFLLNAASRGKLKSFKMGDEWMTTLEWFNDYKKAVKKAIQLEIADKEIKHKKKWVELVPEKNPRLKLAPQMALILFIFSLFSFSLSWLAFSENGHNLALSLHDVTAKKYVVGDYFLNATDKVYGYNQKSFAYVFSNSVDALAFLADSLQSVASDSVYVAVVLDQNLAPYKISDEVITQGFNKLADSLKNRYQAVAGESAVQTNIYFEEWKNSIPSGN